MWQVLERIIAHAPDAVPADDDLELDSRFVTPFQRAALLRRVAHLGVVNLPATELQQALAWLAAGDTVEVVARALAAPPAPTIDAQWEGGRAPSSLTWHSSQVERAEVA